MGEIFHFQRENSQIKELNLVWNQVSYLLCIVKSFKIMKPAIVLTDIITRNEST